MVEVAEVDAGASNTEARIVPQYRPAHANSSSTMAPVDLAQDANSPTNRRIDPSEPTETGSVEEGHQGPRPKQTRPSMTSRESNITDGSPQ